jgi:hypothetical protein
VFNVPILSGDLRGDRTRVSVHGRPSQYQGDERRPHVSFKLGQPQIDNSDNPEHRLNHSEPTGGCELAFIYDEIRDDTGSFNSIQYLLEDLSQTDVDNPNGHS